MVRPGLDPPCLSTDFHVPNRKKIKRPTLIVYFRGLGAIESGPRAGDIGFTHRFFLRVPPSEEFSSS